jgi:hypothetical protein
MLTTDKILAHKTHGRNLILLTQIESSYFFVVAQVVKTKSLFSKKTSNSTLKAIFQKQVSEVEAAAIFNELTRMSHSTNSSGILLLSSTTKSSNASAQEITLLLAGTVQKTETTTSTERSQPIVSPYYPTKDIFLSVQKTRAPATI